jgi:hypothetical protein
VNVRLCSCPLSLVRLYAFASLVYNLRAHLLSVNENYCLLKGSLLFSGYYTLIDEGFHPRVRTHHCKALVESMHQGHALESHDDFPEGIREQLHAKEHQRRG